MQPFELLKRQLDEMAKARQVEQAQADTAARELTKATAEATLDEMIALYGSQLEASTSAADSAQKGRAIKSRGIALCHKDQGFSANGRPVSLLEKATDAPAGHSKVTIHKAAGRTLKPVQEAGEAE